MPQRAVLDLPKSTRAPDGIDMLAIDESQSDATETGPLAVFDLDVAHDDPGVRVVVDRAREVVLAEKVLFGRIATCWLGIVRYLAAARGRQVDLEW